MVAITEPATAFDGIRSLKGFRKTRRVNPGPTPNHLGGMQSTTAEPRGRRGTYRRIGETACRRRLPHADTFPLTATFVAENVEIRGGTNGFRECELGFELRKIGVPGIVFLDDGRIDRVTAI